MLVNINNKEYELNTNLTVTKLLDYLNQSHEGIAVSINQNIINRNQWDNHKVCEGDLISLFQAIAGG